jgi:hypothetical protein
VLELRGLDLSQRLYTSSVPRLADRRRDRRESTEEPKATSRLHRAGATPRRPSPSRWPC